MARKAKRKLPKSIRQAIDAKQKQERTVEAIAPMLRENPVLTRPPELQRPPQLALPAPPGYDSDIPYSAQGIPALPPPESESKTESPEVLLQKMGSQVLVGQESDDSSTFWIDLNEDILEGMRLQITLKPGHRVVAKMFVTSAPTEKFIRERVPRLRKRLQKRGLHLDELEIII